MDTTHLVLEILGGLVVGASLGLLGAGGAILSIPIFALVLGHAQGVAVVESLAVTGAVALFAGVRAALARRVDYARAAALAVPALAGAWIGGPVGKLLGERMQAALFAAIAVVAAWRMLAPPPKPADPEAATRAISTKALAPAAVSGLAIGVLTSVIGVGGGFLLVPVLVLVLRVPMQHAVGTSLLVITTTTVVAIGSKAVFLPDDFARASWQSVAIVALCGIVGSVVGARFARRVPERALRRVFAAVLVLVAVGVAVSAMRAR